MEKSHRFKGNNNEEVDEDDGLFEIAEFYDPIAALLSSIGGEAENLTEQLRTYGIKYEHLSGLSDEDLIIMGLKNKKVREEVLSEIANLPNQMENYDESLRTLKVDDYIGKILVNMSTHLDNLNACLMLTKLRMSKYHVRNVQLSETKYASEVAINVCQKLCTQTKRIRKVLQNLQEGKLNKMEKITKLTHRSVFMKNIVICSFIVGSVCTGFILLRRFSK